MLADQPRRRAGKGHLLRRYKVAMRRLGKIRLQHRFLAAAVLIVALTMIALGSWISTYLGEAVSRGVAETAASSIDSLIATALGPLGPERPISGPERERLEEVFGIGADAAAPRLLAIRIVDLDGDVVFELSGSILAPERPDDLERARGGELVSRVSDLRLEAVGPLAEQPISVLEIHTPIRDLVSGEVQAVADLYYSARVIDELRGEARLAVWTLVSVAGVAVISMLYLFVVRVSRTIETQRRRLASNLAASRNLATENMALHAASERLRQEAAVSGENLLARVGSDLHDGPVQLLTLLILRLSKSVRDAVAAPEIAASLSKSVELASDAIEEMRSISSGLVLPELGELTLEQAIALAVQRHEAATGAIIRRSIAGGATPAELTVKVCAYRVVQEALNNAYWHGDSSRPLLSTSVGDGILDIEVSNDTVPEEQEAPSADTSGIGLSTMRFRVESLGGELAFSVEPDRGAVVRARIPLEGAAYTLSSQLRSRV